MQKRLERLAEKRKGKFGGGMGKAAYLDKLTSKFRFKTVEVNEKLDGSTPPSVFVGRFGYPKVFLGPMMSATEDSFLYDAPELWLNSPQVKSNFDIVQFRLQLVRGKQVVGVKEESRYVEKMQDIALARNSAEVEAEFKKKPRGRFFHEDMQPFGPSGELKSIHTGNVSYNPLLEKAYYDNDLKAREAIVNLHTKGMLFSTIQKALSVGVFGLKKNRKLVPTRWSITAVDSTVADTLIEQVKNFQPIENFRVYEHSSLKNYFAILALPSAWQYEMIEAFIGVLKNERVMFSDYELHQKKQKYSRIGGCYYSGKLAILENLAESKQQAGAIVFRESYPGYIPLGVWNVRENIRQAMKQYKEFENLRDALSYIFSKLHLHPEKWINRSQVLKNFLYQKRLSNFF